MKSLIKIAALAAVLSAPVVSFAQANEPVTRAQVRSELMQVEQAGYSPSHTSDAQYPADIQAAEAKVAASNPGAQEHGYGPSTSGTSQAGQGVSFTASSYSPPLFDHH
jgi:hypothetical protein